MIRFILRRLLESVGVLLIVTTLTFFMMHAAPGGPFDKDKNIPPEIEANIKAYYHLDQPVWKQFVIQMRNYFRGDLGPCYRYANRTVGEIIADSLPVSMELGLWAMLVALSVGLSFGVIASLRPNTLLDYIPSGLAMSGICLPTFVLGPILILKLALGMGWFASSGWDFPRDRVLPALTLGGFFAAYVARLMRGGMLDVLTQDFIRTARAKGASPLRVIMKHALRGGVLPVVSFLGPATADMIAGSFVIETIFNIPGMGRYFVQSAFNRDYCLLLGIVIVYAALVIGFNLLSDIVQVWLNPKLKFE